MPVNWLTIAKMAPETGYSEDVIRTKIRDAVWVEGRSLDQGSRRSNTDFSGGL